MWSQCCSTHFRSFDSRYPTSVGVRTSSPDRGRHMTRTTRRLIARASLRSGTAMVLLAACATTRHSPPVARLVSPADWGTVVDCVVLSARASELYAEVDASGISVTPGFTPLAQQRATARSGVVGSVRITRSAAAEGLQITTVAAHWDSPTVGRRTSTSASATRAAAQQLDAQCVAGYPAASTD